MLEKKKLMINTDLLDARTIKEEDYAGYESILINADLVLVTEESKSILNRLPVTMNTDKVMELPVGEDFHVAVKTINGAYEITGNTVLADHVVLVVNGRLTVHPGTEEVLKKVLTVTVNGAMECPRSLEGYMSGATVNGKATFYPDDAILLKRRFELDRFFPLRAKQGAKYYAGRQITVKNEETDFGKLAEKGVTFETPRLVVPEELAEAAVPLFDEKAHITVIPAGFAYWGDDAVLDGAFLAAHGPRLYIDGDLELGDDFVEIAERVEKLIVKGKVALRSAQKEAFSKVDAEYDELEIIGRATRNQAKATVDRALLEREEDGVRFENIAKVVVNADVDPDLILSRLKLRNVALVVCQEEQKGALAAVAENVAMIRTEEEKSEEGGMGDLLGAGLDALKGLLDTKLINADEYVL